MVWLPTYVQNSERAFTEGNRVLPSLRYLVCLAIACEDICPEKKIALRVFNAPALAKTDPDILAWLSTNAVCIALAAKFPAWAGVGRHRSSAPGKRLQRHASFTPYSRMPCSLP